MTRRNPPAKWVLPIVVDPPRICFQIEVPNERYHLAAFRGAILNLASALKWQDDPAHTAKRVAAVWDDIYLKIRTCSADNCADQGITLEDFMSQQIRISPDDSCIIQMWCIDHWEDWYDPRSCIASGSAQPGGAGELEPGECQSFPARLDGNGKWLLPTSVNEGDVLNITGAAGGWWDGNIGHAWNCPNGQTYALGACVSAGATDAGSPIPALSIGRLILQIGSNYYDAFNQTVVVPGGVTDENVYFQMNDATLGDNAGSVSFTVQVCKSAADEIVGITYDSGSGPASVLFGDEFVAYLQSNSDICAGVDIERLTMLFDQCADVEIVSLSNFVSQSAPPCNVAADGSLYPSCGGASGTYLDPYTTSFLSQGGFEINSAMPGCTVLLKLTRP